jgi:hypothetical protein
VAEPADAMHACLRPVVYVRGKFTFAGANNKG